MIIIGGKSMKHTKIILTTLLFLILFSPVFVHSTIIYIRPPKMIIWADNHPEDVNSVTYSIVVRNENDKPYIIILEESSSLENYVTLHETNFTLQMDEQRDAEFDVDLTLSGQVSGDISVTFTPEDGVGLSVPYAVDIIIYPRGTNPKQPCGEPFCGYEPSCFICSDANGCYNGFYRTYICSNYECIIDIESCSNTCCREYFNNTNAYCEDGTCHLPASNPPTIDTHSPTDLNPTVEVNGTLEFTQTSSDPDGDTLTYSWILDGVENATTESWSYSPTSDELGTHTVIFVVSDGELTDSVEWTVTVLPEGGLLPDGSSCSSNEVCESGHCVHSVCRPSDPYCGDDYCDSGESCSSCSGDCGSCPVTTTPSSSGSSGGGGGGGGGGGSTKTTGFYDFPESLEVEVDSSETTPGEFFSRRTLNNVVFTLTGIDESWYEIDPSALDKVKNQETVDIDITFTIPDYATLTTYPLKLYAETGSLKYKKEFDLIVLAKPETTTESTTTVVTTVPLTTEEGAEQGGVPTGAFAGISSAITKNWYFIPVPFVVAILIWKFYPMLSAASSTKGYVSIKLGNKPRTELGINNTIRPQKTVEKLEKETPKITIDSLEQNKREKTRRKVIEEIRKRALAEDKKFK